MPSNKEPVSPMKIRALFKLKKRKPTIEPIKIIDILNKKIFPILRKIKEKKDNASKDKVPAKPLIPSIKLYAFTMPIAETSFMTKDILLGKANFANMVSMGK
jgi:hypothetical protein